MNAVKKVLTQFLDTWSEQDYKFKKNFILILVSFFLVLAIYPMLRPTTASLYMSSYGGKSTPAVWLYSVVVLSITIFIYNHLYKRFDVRYLFGVTTILSIAIFTVGTLLFPYAKWLAFVLFIWKEVYIVLQIHLILSFFNEVIDVSLAKLFYGLVGAIGSIGGILGGLLVHSLTYSISTEQIILFSAIPLLLSAVVFSLIAVDGASSRIKQNSREVKSSPLQAIREVKHYVLFLVILLALTQVVISLANFKLNIILDQLVPNKDEKTRFLSMLYSWVNVVSLLIQIFVLPYLLTLVSIRKIHLFIPMLYGVAILLGFYLISSLIAVASVFIVLKGSDYSLFNAAKELLYFPLKREQKTGAKYIVDMVAYRGAKGVISFILIFIQSERFITIGLFLSLAAWIGLLIPLLREREQLLSRDY